MTAVTIAATVLNRRYPFVALPEDDGWYIRFPDLPGCTSFAESLDDVGPMARASFELWVESEIEQGHPIPDPTTADPAPGWTRESFVVREPDDASPSPFLTAKDAAAVLGVSHRRVNQLAAKRGVGRMVGNARVFTKADVNALTPGQRGRPRRAVA